MGTLTLPTTGPIYLDASGFIYSVERIEPYRTLLEPMRTPTSRGRPGTVMTVPRGPTRLPSTADMLLRCHGEELGNGHPSPH
jgi:hypothetical protein